jgi:hypothetical protein
MWQSLTDMEQFAITVLVPQREPWQRVRFFNFVRAARYRGARFCWSPVAVHFRRPARWLSWFSWHGWELDCDHVEPEDTSHGKMPGYREVLGHCVTILKCVQITFGEPL